MTRKNKSTNVEQMIGEKRNSENRSGNKNSQNLNNYFVNIGIVEKFFF